MISSQIIGWIVGICAGTIGLGATYYFRLKPDNAVEQIAEEVIKVETGVDVDLSPESKESK